MISCSILKHRLGRILHSKQRLCIYQPYFTENWPSRLCRADVGESQGLEWETAKPEGCCRETCAPHFPYKINHPPAFHCLCSLNLFLPQHTVRLLWLITAYTLWVGVTYPNNVATVKTGATLATWETWVQSLGQKDPLEEGMVTHSSILAWRISWTEEPGRLHTVHGVTKSQTQMTNTYIQTKYWRKFGEKKTNQNAWS